MSREEKRLKWRELLLRAHPEPADRTAFLVGEVHQVLVSVRNTLHAVVALLVVLIAVLLAK